MPLLQRPRRVRITPRHVLTAIGAALILMGAAACARTRTIAVPVHTVHTDTVRTLSLRADTLYVRDSVTVDTSGAPIYRDRLIYRTMHTTDTLRAVRTDTITRLIPGPDTGSATPTALAWYDRAALALGRCAMLAIALALLWALLRSRLRRT